MYLYSVVLLGVFFYNIFRRASYENKLISQTVFTVFIYIFTNRGYFLASDILNVDYWQAAIILEFLLIIVLERKLIISRPLLFFVSSIIISTISLILFPAKNAAVVGTSGSYEYFIAGIQRYITPGITKFTIFFLCLTIIQAFVFATVFKYFTFDSYCVLIKKLSDLCRLIVIIACVEFVMKNVFHSNVYNAILEFVFGKGTSSYTYLIQRGSVYMLTGLNREGAQFAYSLAIVIVVIFADIKINEKRNLQYLWLVLAMGFILLSGAFTMFIVIVMLIGFGVVYYVNKNPESKKKLYRFLGVILCVIPFILVINYTFGNFVDSGSYLANRLTSAMKSILDIFREDDNYFVGLATIDSTTTRIYSVVHTIKNWTLRPFWGLGMATTYCHGATALALGEIGICGIISYMYFYFGRFIRDRLLKSACILTLLIWISVNLLSGSMPRLYLSIDGFLIIACMYVVLYQIKYKEQNIVKY